MSDRPYQTSTQTGSGILQAILVPLGLICLSFAFAAAVIIFSQVNSAAFSTANALIEIERHKLQISQLENAMVKSLSPEIAPGPAEKGPLDLSAFDSINWLKTLKFIGQSHSNQLFLPRILKAQIPAENLETRELKLNLNEISLAVSQMNSTTDHSSAAFKSLTEAALSSLEKYQQEVTPKINDRAQQLVSLKDSLNVYKLICILIMLSSFAACVAVLTYYFLKFFKLKRQIKIQQLLVRSHLSQVKGALFVINRDLEIEFAELDALNLKNSELLNESKSIENYFAGQIDPTELQNWKVALTKLLLDSWESPLHTQTLTHSLKIKQAQGVRHYTVVTGVIKPDKSLKVLSFWAPNDDQYVTQSVEDTDQTAAPIAVQPNPPAAANGPKTDDEQGRQHIRLKKDFSRRLKLIETLTQMDPSIAAEFFKDTRKALQACQMRVTALEKGQHNPSTMLSGLFQVFHQIKGDAAILGLVELSQTVHHLEDQFNSLPHPPTADPDKLAQASERFEQMKRQFESIYRLFFRFNKKDQNDGEDDGQNFSAYIAQFAQKVARDTDKKVKIIDDNLQSVHVPEQQLSQVMTILSQLVRNAIAHGIEDSQTRIRLHKTAYGCLHISAEENDKGLNIRVRDDGRGIEIPKVLSKAKQLGALNSDSTAKMNSKILFNLLATPGLTTQTSVSQHAGRGVGLELVKNIVSELKGSVKVDTKPGQFTEFLVTVPLTTDQSNRPENIPVLIEESQDLTTA